MDYLELGYNTLFQRKPQQQRIQPSDLPDLTAYTLSSMILGLSASRILGGKMTSKDGLLNIDLDAGQITYNDGVVNLFTLGGDSKELTLKNANDTTILSGV